MHRPLVLSALWFAACSAAPVPDPTPDVAPLALPINDNKPRDINENAVLLDLDKALLRYAELLVNQGTQHGDQQIEKLEKYLRDVVLDTGARQMAGTAARDASWSPGDLFRRLQALAIDQSRPWQQGIALSALGFSGRHEVMQTILQGAQLSKPELVDRAVFGLAVLKAPQTPPGVIAAVMMNKDHPEDGRIDAAWALHQLQGASDRAAEYPKIWLGVLDERDRMPAGVLISAVRGLGLTRDTQYAARVLPFLQHPVPLLRCAATIALARMNAQNHWLDLLALLEPAETNQNVRLHARKALVGLAGGVDHGYDLGAWRKTFNRGAVAPAAR
ncbi:MAG: HEAT repeat domain-containing protein [Planctomycetota bacterium]|jgi:HEAT repeat protein